MNKIKAMGITLGACYLAYKFGGREWLKAAALGVAGVVVARQIPVVNTGLSV
jgi:hypothetical protein